MNQPPEYISQEQVKLNYAKSVGSKAAATQNRDTPGTRAAARRPGEAGSIDPVLAEGVAKAVVRTAEAAAVVAPLAVQPTPEKTHGELLKLAVGAAALQLTKANPVIAGFLVLAGVGAYGSAAASQNMNRTINEAHENADPRREGPYQRVPSKRLGDMFSF
jgi:hypothetical protein